MAVPNGVSAPPGLTSVVADELSTGESCALA